MSTSHDNPSYPTTPLPKNEPAERPPKGVDDDPMPRPGPDDPNHIDSRSPAEKAYDDYDTDPSREP